MSTCTNDMMILNLTFVDIGKIILTGRKMVWKTVVFPVIVYAGVVLVWVELGKGDHSFCLELKISSKIIKKRNSAKRANWVLQPWVTAIKLFNLVCILVATHLEERVGAGIVGGPTEREPRQPVTVRVAQLATTATWAPENLSKLLINMI